MAKKKVVIEDNGTEVEVDVPTEDEQGRPLFTEAGGNIVYL